MSGRLAEVRLVVAFRAEGDLLGGSTHLGRTLALRGLAEGLGATLCAFGARTFCFALPDSALEEAVSLALLASIESVPPKARFATAIAQGELAPLDDVGPLAWGEGLLVASALARLARAGEVLLDPDLPAVQRGELLVTGSRVRADEGTRRRALVLDTAQPWRRVAARNVERLARPPVVGREEALAVLAATPAGAAAVLRADPGLGGTRLLLEIGARRRPALFLEPVGASLEPLGALRLSLARRATREEASPLPSGAERQLARLLAGDGIDVGAAAELVAAVLDADGAPDPQHGDRGVLLLDDAAEIDPTTLAVIADAAQRRSGHALVVRLDATSPLPLALGRLAPGPAVDLGPLPRVEAEALTAALFASGATAEVVQRWTRRGGGQPLALVEAVQDGLTSGELRWGASAPATPRSRVAGRGRPASARHWIARRLRHVDRDARGLLTALAVLGGDAPDVHVDALVAAMGLPARVAAWEELLSATGWIARPEPGFVRLPSRTLRAVLLYALEDDARKAWHRAAAATLELRAGRLGLAEAAWHAAEAGEGTTASRLALEAARGSAACSLRDAAAMLLAFAHAHDPALARQERDWLAEVVPDPVPARLPLDAVELGADVALAGDLPPRPPLATLVDDAMFAQFDRGPTAPDAPAAPAAVSAPSSSRVAPASTGPTRTAKLLAQAREAMREREPATLDRTAEELRAAGGSLLLAERLAGIAALTRGATGDALRLLREGVDRAEGEPAPVRARTLLAYAVALAAAGRAKAALCEALRALARAREGEDRAGEKACVRFLAQLSERGGRAGAAAAWRDVERALAGTR